MASTHLHASAICFVLGAFVVALVACGPATRQAEATTRTPVVARREQVTLSVPGEPGHWILRNETSHAIYAIDRDGFSVRVECLDSGEWKRCPNFIGRICPGSLAPTKLSLGPGEHLELEDYAGPFPVGNYRGVVDYLGESAASALRIKRDATLVRSEKVILSFGMSGLSGAQSDAFMAVLSQPGAMVCMSTRELLLSLSRAAWDGVPVERLVDLPVIDFHEAIALGNAIEWLSDADEWLKKIEAAHDGEVAVGIELTRFRSQQCAKSAKFCREMTEHWIPFLKSEGSPTTDLLCALSMRSEQWSPMIAPALVHALQTTKSMDTLQWLAHDLYRMPDDALAAVGVDAIANLRKRARGKIDANTKEVLEDAAEHIAQRINPEPGVLEIGRGWGCGIPDRNADTDPRCGSIRHEVAKILPVGKDEELGMEELVMKQTLGSLTHDYGRDVSIVEIPWLLEDHPEPRHNRFCQ